MLTGCSTTVTVTSSVMLFCDLRPCSPCSSATVAMKCFLRRHQQFFARLSCGRTGVWFLLLLLGQLGFAANLTPAGTALVVQATATATNSIGTPQAAQAEPWLSTVQPALGVALAPLPQDGGERTSVAGTRVDIPFRVTNLGNAEAPVRLALTLTRTGLANEAVEATLVIDNACDARRSSDDSVINLAAVGPHLTLPYATERCLVLALRFTSNAATDGRIAFELRVSEILGGHPRPPTAANANLTSSGAVRISDTVASFQLVSAQSNVLPGESARYLLRVSNLPETPAPLPETYLLRATGTPSSFTPSVAFHEANCSAGVGQAIERAVQQLGPIPPEGVRCVLAVVPTARNAVSGSQFRLQNADQSRSLRFAAVRASDPERSATLVQVLDVLHVAGLEWGPSRSAVLRSPGEVTITQTVRNSGNTAGVVTFGPVAALPAGSAVVTFARAGEPFTPTLSVPLAAAGELGSDGKPADVATIEVRVESASGLTGGLKVRTPVVASLRYGAGIDAAPNVGILEALSLSTFDVVTGSLAVEVAVCRSESATPPCAGDDGSTIASGDYLHYTITLRNDGGAPVPQVILTDPLPMFTRFVTVQAAANFPGTVLYSADGQTFAPAPPTTVGSGGAISVAVRTTAGTGTVITAADQVPPGGEVRMQVVVQVR